jgi:hypothetical protein
MTAKATVSSKPGRSRSALHPSGATLYLNEKEHGNANGTIRFLTPGDYDIRISKDDYFNWTKRLNVREQYVTWANQNIVSLVLFYAQPEKQNIADDVLNFFAGQNRLVVIQKDKLLISKTDSPTDSKAIALPRQFSNYDIQASPDENYFILSASRYTAIVDAKAGTLTDISAVIAKQAAFTSTSDFAASEQVLKFSESNNLYQLQNGSVYKIDWQKNTKTLFLDNVIAFYPTKEAVYYINSKTGATGIERDLVVSSLSEYQPKVLVQNLPSIHRGDLLLSAQNQLFILGDGTLYSLDKDIRPISNYVQAAYIDNADKQLVYSTGNEINFYDLNSGSTNLITRSSSQIDNPIALPGLGWVFYVSDNRLQDIEIDNRDHQNNYTFASVSDNAKYFVDSKANYLILLDQGKLTRLKIR